MCLKTLALSLILSPGLWITAELHAEDEPAVPPVAPQAPMVREAAQAAEPAAAPKPKPSTSSKKSRRRSDRETEGTEAHDRFEAETVIKSHYQLRGEPLEVDPD